MVFGHSRSLMVDDSIGTSLRWTQKPSGLLINVDKSSKLSVLQGHLMLDARRADHEIIY